MTDTVPEGDYAKEAGHRAFEVIMLLAFDAPLSRVFEALQEFREAVKREVSS